MFFVGLDAGSGFTHNSVPVKRDQGQTKNNRVVNDKHHEDSSFFSSAQAN